MKKVFLLSLFAVTSCASILDGNKQHVSLRLAPDVPGQCIITERNAPQQVITVPGEFDVSRSYYPMNIDCTANKAGKKGSARVYSDVSNLAYTGAVASVGVGTLVDSTTGDAFEYPAQLTVKLGTTTEIGKNSMNSNVEFNK